MLVTCLLQLSHLQVKRYLVDRRAVANFKRCDYSRKMMRTFRGKARKSDIPVCRSRRTSSSKKRNIALMNGSAVFLRRLFKSLSLIGTEDIQLMAVIHFLQKNMLHHAIHAINGLSCYLEQPASTRALSFSKVSDRFRIRFCSNIGFQSSVF